MKRRHFHPLRCWVCGRHVSEVGHISQTGLCPEHSVERMVENFDSLKAKEGAGYRRWRARLVASLGAVRVEHLDATTADAQTPR